MAVLAGSVVACCPLVFVVLRRQLLLALVALVALVLHTEAQLEVQVLVAVKVVLVVCVMFTAVNPAEPGVLAGELI